MDYQLVDTYNNGRYYNPAWKHYGRGTVNCDRCKASNLKVCIGYKELDLCMRCVEIMSELIPNNDEQQVLTKMAQGIYRPETRIMMRQSTYEPFITTNMEQSIFKSKRYPNNLKQPDDNHTFMMQSMFDRGDPYSDRGGNSR